MSRNFVVLYFIPSPPHPLPTHPRHPAARPRGGMGGGHGGTEVYTIGVRPAGDLRTYVYVRLKCPMCGASMELKI